MIYNNDLAQVVAAEVATHGQSPEVFLRMFGVVR